MAKKQTGFYVAVILGLILIALIVTQILQRLNLRVDLTTDQRFSLTEGSKNILNKLDAPVSIRYYFSKQDGIPLVLANFSKRVDDLLLEYKKQNPKFITVEKFNPLPDTDDEDAALVDGIEELGGQGIENFYLGIAISSLDKKAVLSRLDFNREELLEYNLSRAILQVTQDKKPKLAIMTDLPLAGMPFSARPLPAWFFYSQLEKDYNVQLVATKEPNIPSDSKVLLVFHPYEISDSAQYAIDQFLLAGGKVIAVVDPLFFASQFFNPPQQNPMMRNAPQPNRESDLPKLFEAWGIKYDNTKVIADKILQSPVSQTTTAPTVLTCGPENLSKTEIISLNLNDLMLIQAGSLEYEVKEGLSYSELVTSSTETEMISPFRAEINDKTINELQSDFVSSGEKRIMALAISGKFTSAFPSGKPGKSDGDDAKKQNSKKDKKDEPKVEHLKESNGEGAVLVISDVDFLFDQFAINKVNFLGQTIVSFNNSNISFIENSVEFFAGGSDLIKVRSRVSPRRPFTVIREKEHKAEVKFANAIKKLQDEATEVEERINQLQLAKDQSQKFVLSEEQKHELENFRKKQKNINKDLRELKKELRKDINKLKANIKAINFLATPILLTAFGIFYAIRRKVKTSAHN